jgi:hypothetical protein
MRDREKFYDELKWNKVSGKKMCILETALDVFFGCDDASFSAFIVDKEQHDVTGRFGGQFAAYDAIARQLVHGSIRHGEVLWVIADEYSTPPTATFEESVQDHVNKKLRRPAAAGRLAHAVKRGRPPPTDRGAPWRDRVRAGPSPADRRSVRGR